MEYHDTAPAEPDGGDHERAPEVLDIAGGPLPLSHELGWTTERQAAHVKFGRRR